MCFAIDKLSHNLHVVRSVDQFPSAMKLPISKRPLVIALILEGVGASAVHLSLPAYLTEISITILKQYFLLCHFKINHFIE